MPGLGTIKVGQQHTRALFVPSSYNEAERTVDVTFATDTPVLSYSWDGPFYEVLDMAGHKTDRSSNSLPVLDNHKTYGGVKDGVLGRAENIRLQNGEWVATVRFSSREEVKGVIQDVRDGILQDVSVGYNVFRYEASPMADTDEIPTYIARSWESFEISFVLVPADSSAKVRSIDPQNLREIEVTQLPTQHKPTNNNTMKRELIIATLQKRGIAVPENATDEQLTELLERAMETQNPTPPAGGGDAEAAARAATTAERSRVREITEAVRAANLPETFAQTHIDSGANIGDVRAAVITEMARINAEQNAGTRGANGTRVSMGVEAIEKVRNLVINALENRLNPSVALIDGAREFRGMRMVELAKDFLVRGGMTYAQVRELTEREVCTLALGGSVRGYHSTSDLPAVFGNTINRTLRREYDLVQPTWAPFVSRGTINDFRPVTRAQLSQLVGGFDAIPEGGEYKSASLTDGKEVYKLVKYGKIINYTWEMMVDDDLNALSRIPKAMANKARQKQSDIIYNDILIGNPLMGDGVAIFAAGHGNLAGAGAAITATSLSTARAAMRVQKDLNGEDFINVTPRYLVVGPAKETEAQMLLQAVIMATKTADTNVFKGYVELIVEPRITDNSWFLIGDPAQYDTIEVSTLDGESDLFTEQRQGFDIDGIQLKARMVWAAKALDWKAMYKNPGA